MGELIELGVASRLLLGLASCIGLGERELTVEELGPAARARVISDGINIRLI